MRAEIARIYEDLVAASGTPRMAQVLFDAFGRSLPIAELFAFERRFVQGCSFLLQYGEAIPGSIRLQTPQNRYRTVDPLTRVLLRRSGGVLTTLSLSAAQIRDPRWRRDCYDRFDYGERISLAKRHSRGWSVLNLYRYRRHGPASNTALQRLQEIASLALPLIEKHCELESRRPDQGRSPLEYAKSRMLLLYPELAHREREVCARTLLGEHSEDIARTLSLSKSSVLTYRRRAYAKLNISSAAQLTGSLLA